METGTKNRYEPALIKVDKQTLIRLREIADGKPVATYLRELSLEWPRQPKRVDIEKRLSRIEKILGARVSIDDVVIERLTLDEAGIAGMKAMLNHFGVDALDEVCDALKWYRENGNEHDRLEAMRVYHELAELFGFPTLTDIQMDKLLRFTFRLVEKINNLRGNNA